MRKQVNETARRNIRLPILIAVALVLIAIFISLFRDMGLVGLIKLRNTEKHLRFEVDRLRQENAELKSQVEGLRSNPTVIEEEARRMGLIKEKERVIVMPPSRDSRETVPSVGGAKRP